MYMYGRYGMFLERYSRKLCFILAVMTAAVVTWTAAGRTEAAEQAEMQKLLSQEVLRFHVVADSDRKEDQELKLKVRDGVLEYLEEEMPDESISEIRSWVRGHTDQIEEVCRKVLSENNSDQTVSAAVTTCYFPDKTYGTVTFPAGNYEALRIELGAAEGHNWWCVLYPGLCYQDSVNAVLPEGEKQKLKNVLTEEEYSRMTAFSDFEIGWFFLK